MTTATLTMIRPDDWHLHFRDGAMLDTVVPATAEVFARAIVMPNLAPPVVTTAEAQAYRTRILSAAKDYPNFTPLMTAYMTQATDPDDLAMGFESGVLTAVKLYPAGATTNSDSGVRDVTKIDPVLTCMAEIGMPLLIHGEVTHAEVDIFDREAVFIDTILKPLIGRHPDLKVVLEHITTREAAAFVRAAGSNVAATITPHHLEINRTDIFKGGIRPHLYCLPIAKRETHRLAVREAAVSGHKRFFLGTDSAPHERLAKEAACGCAGIYNAPGALAHYAGVFEAEGVLDRLEAFASVNGPRFYGLPVNKDTVTIERSGWKVPELVEAADDIVLPYRAGETLAWRIRDA